MPLVPPSAPTLDRLVKITIGGDLAVVTSRAPGPTPPPPSPSVDFMGSPLSGNIPLVVSFTDETSGGSPSAWAWDFGDGGSSTVQDPMHTYTGAGVYTVGLIATVSGTPYSASKPNYITATTPTPVADFSGTPRSGTASLSVVFTDETTGGTPTAWAWTFGDGGTSTVQNPTHNYITAGTYTVAMTATVGGTPYPVSKSNYVVVSPAPPPDTLDLANLPDISGNGNGLMIGGAHTPTFSTDPFGIGQDGLIFDGIMQAAGAGPDWNPPFPNFTYQFRLIRDVAHLGSIQGVFGRWATTNGTADSFQFLCYFDTSNNLNFLVAAVNNASATFSVSIGPITDALPHAIQFALTGAVLYGYLDGVRVATIAANIISTIPNAIAMEFGTYQDENSVAAGGNPFHGVLGDFMVSNIARNTGASYVVPTTPAAADANTVSLISMASATGNYIETPTFSGTCLVRGSYTQASGGWAGVDGPLPAIGGGWFFSVNGYDGTKWTVWGVTAPDLNTLITGGGTVGAQAIQTPSTGEVDLAGNGSVVAFLGQYWHFYHDGNGSMSANVRYSTGTDLGLPFSPQPGNILFTGYFDPFTRVSEDGTTLTMYMGSGTTGVRAWHKTTSTDGVTWTTPVLAIPDIVQAGFINATGAFALTNFHGVAQFGFSDGAKNGGNQRNLMGWGTQDGTNWVPLFLRLTAAGAGNDAGGHPYLSVSDSSYWWDAPNHRLIMLNALSTNTQPTQPTDSDVGVYVISVSGL